jgi:hypothetical protein
LARREIGEIELEQRASQFLSGMATSGEAGKRELVRACGQPVRVLGCFGVRRGRRGSGPADQQSLGSISYPRREAGQPGHMDAVGPVGRARSNAIQEDHSPVLLHRRDMDVGDAWQFGLQCCQLEEVGRKKRASSDPIVQVFQYSPGDGEPVLGGGAPSDFVEDHEAALGGLAENGGRFHHLDHEGALPTRQIVVRTDTTEDAIDESDAGACRGDEGTDLRQEHDQGDLPKIGALAAHVRSGDQEEAWSIAAQLAIVGDERLSIEQHFDDGMTPTLDQDRVRLVQFRAAPVVLRRDFGQGAEGIEPGDPASKRKSSLVRVVTSRVKRASAARSSSAISASAASRRASASLSSGVMKRSPVATVCLRT